MPHLWSSFLAPPRSHPLTLSLTPASSPVYSSSSIHLHPPPSSQMDDVSQNLGAFQEGPPHLEAQSQVRQRVQGTAGQQPLPKALCTPRVSHSGPDQAFFPPALPPRLHPDPQLLAAQVGRAEEGSPRWLRNNSSHGGPCCRPCPAFASFPDLVQVPQSLQASGSSSARKGQ